MLSEIHSGNRQGIAFIFHPLTRSMLSVYFAPIFKAQAYYMSDAWSASQKKKKKKLFLNFIQEDRFYLICIFLVSHFATHFSFKRFSNGVCGMEN